MGNLIRRTKKNSVGTVRGSGIADQHVDDLDFTDSVQLFGDLNLDIPSDAGPEVTSHVDLDPRVRRAKDTGRHYRKRLAWWAGRGGIIVVDQRQPLIARPDGKYQPNGPWVTLTSDFYRAVEPARRRVANLPTTAGRSAETDMDAAASGSQDPAEVAIGLLPEPARRAFLHGIDQPLHQNANAIRATFPGQQGATFLVSALRMNTTKGTVIHAEHQTGATTWKINHVNYTFATSVPLIETAP